MSRSDDSMHQNIAANIAQFLAMDACSIISAHQCTFARDIWMAAFAACPLNQIVCFVAFDNYQKNAIQSAYQQHLDESPDMPFDARFASLFDLLSLKDNHADLFFHMRQNARFIIWLQPDDLCDNAIDLWFDWMDNAHFPVIYLWPDLPFPSLYMEKFKSFHPDIQHIVIDNPIAFSHIQIYFAQPDINGIIDISNQFWNDIHHENTIIEASSHADLLRFAQTSCQMHQQVSFFHETPHLKSLQHYHLMSAHAHAELSWPLKPYQHKVMINTFPPMNAAAYAPRQSACSLSFAVSSRFALLTAIASIYADPNDILYQSNRHSQRMVKLWSLYRIFHHQIASQDFFISHSNPDFELISKTWHTRGWIDDNAHLTSAGKNLFRGVKSIAQMYPLFFYAHDDICLSPARDPIIHVKNGFLRSPSGAYFSLDNQCYHRYFHHILGGECVIRPADKLLSPVWIDALPVHLSRHMTNIIKRILLAPDLYVCGEGEASPCGAMASPQSQSCTQPDYSPYIIDNAQLGEAHTHRPPQLKIELSTLPHFLDTHALNILNDLKKSFLSAFNPISPDDMLLEVGPHEAQWWTFAGADYNLLCAQIIEIIAPKLSVSYGNLNLLFRWDKAATCSIHAITSRLESMIMQTQQIALGCASNEILHSIQSAWAQTHLYHWILPLIPDSWLDEWFEHDFNDFSQIFRSFHLQTQIVDQLIHIDRDWQNLDIQHAGYQTQTPKQSPAPSSQSCVSLNAIKMKKSEPNPHQADVNFWISATHIHSQNHSAAPVQGIIHTKLPWVYVDNHTLLSHAITDMLKYPYIGLDVETTLYHQQLRLIQIGCPDMTWLIDPLYVDYSGLAQVLEHPQIIKLIHHASFEKSVMAKSNIQINHIIDTESLSKKLYGSRIPGGHSLKAVVKRVFDMDMDKTCQTSNWGLRPLSNVQLEYGALDAEILVRLYETWQKPVI